MINYDYIAKENIKNNIKNFDHSYRTIRGSGTGKTNALLNLIKLI